MIQAYIDDSTSDVGDQRLVLAGFINAADRWTRFSEAWAGELRQPPAINYLKMSEANRLGGEFRGWDASDRDEKLKRLARVIRHFEPRSIHASVSRTEFNSIVAPVAPHGFGIPYAVCFQALMLPLAISQSRQKIRVPIDFIFDDQEGLGKQAAFFYEKIRGGQPKKIREVMCKSPIFRDEKDVLPLQAADMLAWHVRRGLETAPESFPIPEYLSHDGLHMAVDIQAEHLKPIANGFAKIPGVPHLKTKSAWKKTFREIERLEALGIDTSKIKRPGTYYPKSAPLLLRWAATLKRSLHM